MSLINRIFPEVFRDASRAFAALEDPFFNAARRLPPNLGFRPLVDISETDKAYLVEAEVPGLKKEDLEIELTDDNTLVLKGKIERSKEIGAPPVAGHSDETVIEHAQNQNQKSTDVVSTGGGRETAVTDPRQTWWSSERVLGSFQRVFTFPGKIDPANVQATYKDGILTVVVPKPERQVNKISIE